MSMKKFTALGLAAALFAAAGVLGASAHAAQHEDDQQMPEMCQMMMQKMEKMHQEQQQMAQKLETQLEEMREAQGEEKSDAMADVVELLAEQHLKMAEMLDEMSKMRSEHMNVHMSEGGMGCPMMQAMQKKSDKDAYAGKAKRVTVEALDFEFDPSTIKVKPGQKVVVTLDNKGDAPHNIEFELPDGEVELENVVQGGESAELTFTAPDEEGTYTFYCPVGNHLDRGMEGDLVVQK
jgi:plastocyanin